MGEDFTKLDKESQRILMALTNMYLQYCNSPYGHDFMSAGESAIEVLEDYGLADEKTGVVISEADRLEELL